MGRFFILCVGGGDGHPDGDPTNKQVLQVKRSETVAIWKGARTQSVWEYTIGCVVMNSYLLGKGGVLYIILQQ